MTTLDHNNPDVLLCLANLSSDEVFTPPKVANAMLDMLPQELFTRPDTKFLDPASKSGVFLREIARRLIAGLEREIPDLRDRVEHIFREQIFGLAITELTGLISRRSVYCSKDPSSKYSVCRFDNAEGNIRFRRLQHTFSRGRCVFCGASIDEPAQRAEVHYERDEESETHAYEFIHRKKPEEIFDMEFDVIISNPPYQLNDGGYGSSAKPLYQNFVEQAKKLNPRYISMIIPARWVSGGKGLNDFREAMLNDDRIRIIHDFFNSEECFPGVDLSGGVCYFLWDRDNRGECEITSSINGKQTTLTRPLLKDGSKTFLRFNESVSIVEKISSLHENSFASIVSSRKPFGFTTDVLGEPLSEKCNVRLYANKNAQKEAGYISLKSIMQNIEWVDKHKVYISSAYGERGKFPYLVTGKPFIGETNTCCSETYLVIGPFDDEATAQNVISYITTRFFRFLVLLLKNTQHATKAVYQLVPMQDFSHSWTDAQLYAKYNLDESEISFIESMIRPMELSGDE